MYEYIYWLTEYQNTVEEKWRKTVQQQLRRKWNWLGHTLRSDDSIAKQVLQWTLQGREEEVKVKVT